METVQCLVFHGLRQQDEHTVVIQKRNGAAERAEAAKIQLLKMGVFQCFCCHMLEREPHPATLAVSDNHVRDKLNVVVLCNNTACRAMNRDMHMRAQYFEGMKGKCCVCGADAPKNCGQCKHVFYCSEKCQRADWAVHKHVCGLVQKAGQVLKKEKQEQEEEMTDK